jgi:uncharacterized repeat protein (TIGR02543 family)
MAIGFGIDIAISPPVVSLEDDDMGYIVSFDSQGGSFVPAIGVATGAAIGTLPIAPTRTGYDFSGWFTKISGGTVITSSTIVTASMTVYAHWSSGSLPIGIGKIKISAKGLKDESIDESSTFAVDIEFTDEAGNAFTPNQINWSLYTEQGSIVNHRADVLVDTPSSSIRLSLSEGDNTTTAWRSEQILVVMARYTNSLGQNILLVGTFHYFVLNVFGV